MRLTRLDGLLKNLKGEIPERARREYLPREMAHQLLMELSGETYSIDAVGEWEEWARCQHQAGRL